jgi:hypothetical protein
MYERASTSFSRRVAPPATTWKFNKLRQQLLEADTAVELKARQRRQARLEASIRATLPRKHH